MSRPKKFIRPQFSNFRFQIESAWAHSLSTLSFFAFVLGFIAKILVMTLPAAEYSPQWTQISEQQARLFKTLHLRHVVLLVLFPLLPSSLQSENWQDVASDLLCRDNSSQIREKTSVIFGELKTQFGGPGW